MNTPIQRANELSQLVIGAAIEVHRIKGPGLIEEIYSKCLGRECELRNIPCVKELRVFLEYKGFVFEQRRQIGQTCARDLFSFRSPKLAVHEVSG
jgi:GxxExxY protein